MSGPARRGQRTPIVRRRRRGSIASIAVVAAVGATASCDDGYRPPTGPDDEGVGLELDRVLGGQLAVRGFTGRIAETLEARLGRPIDPDLAEVGRLLFFDPVLSITRDNSCSGCHGPNSAFNDAESIAIGVGSNGVVGPGRTGPHNLRRAPSIINAAFYPKLMWDGRFESTSLDPFDNSRGFVFPEPEGRSLSHMDHLLGAQAFTPVVARPEMAGFDFVGDNEAMRAELLGRVNDIAGYRTRFAWIFPEVAAGGPITYEHVGAALAEFTFTLVRADAPIDRYARGDTSALTPDMKRGAILFFGFRASCAECHMTQSFGNEMFSDFEAHVLAVPQLAPTTTNVVYDGPGSNEDFGLERHTGAPEDRYKFRTTPLRNVAFQPTFMHNGAFVCLENAIRHHTDVYTSLANYSTDRLDPSVRGALGPVQPMLDRIHPLSQVPRDLDEAEFNQLLLFVRDALTDPEAHPDRLRHLVPATVPSGLPVHTFETTTQQASCN